MKKNPFILVYRMKGFFCFYLHDIVKGTTKIIFLKNKRTMSNTFFQF